MPKKTDAQSIRSKQWMLEALIALMKEKNFDDISISEIARRAGLDRRTFYRHFRSKESIIIYRIQELSDEYVTVLRQNHPMNTKAIAQAFFTICQSDKEFLVLLYKHRQLPLLLYELNTIFPKHHYKYHIGEDLYHPFDTEYALSYHVGGFWNMLIKWLSDGMAKSPEELADTIQHFLPEFI